jgi:cation diffusion facilitator family transporter
MLACESEERKESSSPVRKEHNLLYRTTLSSTLNKPCYYEKLGIIVTFILNVCLLISKLAIAILSSSVIFLASMIDSLLDVITCILLWYTTNAAKTSQYDRGKYPVGITRIQPLGILIFSAIMAMASVEILKQSIHVLVQGFAYNEIPSIQVGWISIGTFIGIIFTKMGMLAFCLHLQSKFQRVHEDEPFNIRQSANLKALSQDHFNDILSNTFSIVVAIIAAKYKNQIWFADAVGAIVISIFIIRSWIIQGKDQIEHLIGVSANEEVIDSLKQMALEFDERIMGIETFLVYHLGDHLIVECHIILPPEMPLIEAHDIGERLEDALEASHRIERAFVHLDYLSELIVQSCSVASGVCTCIGLLASLYDPT